MQTKYEIYISRKQVLQAQSKYMNEFTFSYSIKKYIYIFVRKIFLEVYFL